MSYKRWLLVATVIFGISILTGLVASPDILSEDIADFEEIVELLAEMPQSAVFIFILFKNGFALLLSFALSPILCLAPLAALTVNGWLLAVVGTTVVQQESFGVLLAGLLPHGIFEIPAFIMAEAAALSFGATVLRALFRKEKRGLVIPSFKQNARYIAIALVLLLPAAAIETFITPLLMNWVGGL